MRLVLEEYLKTLREKDELDLLLCDLLLLEGYTVFNRPRTGERQYGVDILAKKDERHFFLWSSKRTLLVSHGISVQIVCAKALMIFLMCT